MNSLRIYLRERFPLPITTALALATATILVATTGLQGLIPRIVPSLLVGLLLVAFMFRMRVADEFKDAAHDRQNYPNRPVQRGVISKRTLLKLGLAALTVELVCAWAVGAIAGRPASVFWYLPALGFSALTIMEFFAGRFLERHFNLYFVLHQGVWVFIAIWARQALSPHPSTASMLPMIGFVLLMVMGEVARKYEVRLDTDGNPVADTYITVWGRTQSAALMATGLIVAGVLIYSGVPNIVILLVALGGTAGIAVFEENDKTTQASFYLAFLGIAMAVWI